MGQKNLLFKNILGKKKCFGWKVFWYPHFFGPKILGLKLFRVQTKFCAQKILGPKNWGLKIICLVTLKIHLTPKRHHQDAFHILGTPSPSFKTFLRKPSDTFHTLPRYFELSKECIWQEKPIYGAILQDGTSQIYSFAKNPSRV